MEQEPWFEPKSRGYGAGMPIHPRGWMALGLYVAGMIGSSLLFMLALPAALGMLVPKAYGAGWTVAPHMLPLFVILWVVLGVAPLTLWFMAVARARTRGGWRWRSGKDRE